MDIDKDNPHFKMLRNLMVTSKNSELHGFTRVKKTKERKKSINLFFERQENWEQYLNED